MSTPYLLPQPRPFQPRYVLQSELARYGLPTVDEAQGILSLVDAASVFIDEWCGRTDGNGQGSLVWCTYQERILLQAGGRNIFRVNFKPMAVVPASTVNALTASASFNTDPDPENVNYFYTGCQPNTVTTTGGTLSSIISCSGRYGYPRRGDQAIYPDLNYGANLLQVASFFGGPPPFVAMDASAIDFDTATGECWVPAGLYYGAYTEVIITYNSGFDPNNIPRGIKQGCVGLVKNYLARGGGTYGLKSIQSSGSVNYTFTDDDLDATTTRFLMAYKTVTAY